MEGTTPSTASRLVILSRSSGVIPVFRSLPLTLTVSGTTLTAGSQSFTLSNLSKMYVSNVDETTAIESITPDTLDESTDIYDLQGHKISREQMKKGVYIVKTKSRTYKIIVR